MIVILQRAANVQRRQCELQYDQSVRVGMPTPRYPQDVAGKEAPEPEFAPVLRLRSNEPRCQYSRHHPRPLQCVEHISHWGPSRVQFRRNASCPMAVLGDGPDEFKCLQFPEWAASRHYDAHRCGVIVMSDYLHIQKLYRLPG